MDKGAFMIENSIVNQVQKLCENLKQCLFWEIFSDLLISRNRITRLIKFCWFKFKSGVLKSGEKISFLTHNRDSIIA